ncbi:MAG: hypothetical protein ACLFTI_04425 [Anaerolineales bacterium]
MKRWGALLALGLALLWTTPLIAQGGGEISPAQLTISGMRGQRVSRTLLVRPAEDITGLRVVSLDLEDTQGEEVFPASAIHTDLPDDEIAAQSALTVPLTFDLTSAPSGKFSGELLFSYDGGSFSVPVTVHIKDRPYLAFAILLAGVALGVGVSQYRAQGRPRDEILVRLGQLRTQLKGDVKLREEGKPFHDRIEAELVDVEVELERREWKSARQALAEAEELSLRWRRGRSDWLVQIEAYQALLEKIDELDECRYLREVQQAAQDAYRDLPDLDEPVTFRSKLDPLRRHVNRFLVLNSRIADLRALASPRAPELKQKLFQFDPTSSQEGLQALADEVDQAAVEARREDLQKKVDQLQALSEQIPGPEAAKWQEKAADYAAQISKVQDQSDYLALHRDIQQVRDALLAIREINVEEGGDFSMAPRPKGPVPFSETMREAGYDLLPGLPNARPQSYTDLGEDARKRLHWFTWLTYGVAVLFLALSGFVELYAARADFGARGVGDYFMLLAWGFGAEATRAAVAEMVQGWGITSGGSV